MGRIHAGATIALVLGTLLAACGSAPSRLASLSTTTVPVPTTTIPAPPDITAPPPSSTVTTQGVPIVSTPSTPLTTSPLPDPMLARVGAAGQAIVVSASGYGVTSATLTAYERDGGRWRVAMGPWTARVGYNGFAPPDQKREGDGRTPSGVYGFGFFFGVDPDPGVRFEYRQVPDDTIVWDEDPTSPTYNLWIDLDDRGGGHDPEGMYRPVAYQYGAVIAYNTARVPGLGSGIFLHATTGRPTAGCVSLPVNQLVSVLRWLDPAQSPRIVMGVAS